MAPDRALVDVVRPESRREVERLHEMGVEVAMLTCDSQAVESADIILVKSNPLDIIKIIELVGLAVAR